MKPRSFKACITDMHFLAAVLAAIVFWVVLFFWQQPRPEIFWPMEQWQIVLQVALLYPVVEEWVFRGFIQGHLLERSWGKAAFSGITAANLLTSIVFTSLHFLHHPPLAAVSVLIPSLVFGYFRDRHGRLAGAVLLHAYYNLGYFWLFS